MMDLPLARLEKGKKEEGRGARPYGAGPGSSRPYGPPGAPRAAGLRPDG